MNAELQRVYDYCIQNRSDDVARFIEKSFYSCSVPAAATPTQINEILKNYRYIEFPKDAKLNITSTLQVYSNTTIDLNGCRLRRYCNEPVIRSYCSSLATGYDGVKNVVIKNGTIEGMNSIGKNAGDLSAWLHMDGLTFENVTFLDAVGSHCIDLLGCKNVTIKNCKFLGYKSYGSDFREAIQIDTCHYGGFPIHPKGSKSYDLTKCRDILIDGCTFDKSSSYPPQFIAIGNHEQTIGMTWNENITIRNCTGVGNGISKGSGFFVRLLNMRNVLVENNTVKNYGRLGVYLNPTRLVDANTVAKETNKSNTLTVQDITFKNNKVLSNGHTYKAYGVWIEDKYGTAKNIKISNDIKSISGTSGCSNVSYI